jgi:hypothetical protein
MCFTGEVNAISRKSQKEYYNFGSGESIKVNSNFVVSSVTRFQPDKIDPWAKWNLSFSGKNLRDGSTPPALKIETASDTSTTESSQEIVSIPSPPKKDKASIKFVKEPSVRHNIDLDSKNRKDVPKVVAKPSFPKAKPKADDKYKSLPTLPSLPEPDYPVNNKLPEESDSAVKTDLSKANGHKGEEDYADSVEKEFRKKLHKGAYYYIDNSKRQDENPADVPGYELNAPPMGPAQNGSNYDPPGFLTAPQPGH